MRELSSLTDQAVHAAIEIDLMLNGKQTSDEDILHVIAYLADFVAQEHPDPADVVVLDNTWKLSKMGNEKLRYVVELQEQVADIKEQLEHFLKRCLPNRQAALLRDFCVQLSKEAGAYQDRFR